MDLSDRHTDYIYDRILELDIATEAEIDLVVKINGWSTETLEDILYVRTGYRTISQIDDHDEYLYVSK